MAEDVVDDKTLDAEMTESIGNLLRDIRSREAEPDAAPDKPEKVAAVETAADTEKSEERTRDASGKFVKQDKPAEEPKVSAAPAATPSPPQPVQGASEPVAAEPFDLNRAPSSWKPVAKAAWAALPEPVRAEIYRREGDFHNGYKGIKETADFGQTMQRVIDPFRELLAAERTTPEKAVASLMNTAATLRRGSPQQKQAAILGIMQEYGVALPQQAPVQSQDGQQPAQGQPQVYSDPRVDTLLSHFQAQERFRQDQATQASNDATERFLSAVGPDKQPLHPFVDNVMADMSQRVGVIRAGNPSISHDEVLKQAYEQAVWANPETREVLLKQAQAQQPAETLRKVEQAERAARFNTPRRGALPATEPAKSLEETIRDTGRELGMF